MRNLAGEDRRFKALVISVGTGCWRDSGVLTRHTDGGQALPNDVADKHWVRFGFVFISS